MKKLVVNLLGYSQNAKKILKSVTFNQKVINKKGTQLVLKKVTNDSRCPEGVQCIWAGECEIVVSVYRNNKFIKDEKVLLSPKLYKENIAWFAKYYTSKKITEINVLPYPKNEVVINAKDYFVKLELDK
jgi:hypothetical protein